MRALAKGARPVSVSALTTMVNASMNTGLVVILQRDRERERQIDGEKRGSYDKYPPTCG